MQNFADKKGNGSYEAISGHDDLMMTQVQLAAMKETVTFKYFIDEIEETSNNEIVSDLYNVMNE